MGDDRGQKRRGRRCSKMGWASVAWQEGAMHHVPFTSEGITFEELIHILRRGTMCSCSEGIDSNLFKMGECVICD